MGLDRLVEAVKQITDEGQTLRLLIGGSGSMEGELRAQIMALGLEDTVFLLGRVPDEQLVDTFAAADCFVLPTTALECFGLITLESYACGVPVIATPVAAIPEIVKQHDASWLTSGTSASEIAVTLRKFLSKELEHDAGGLRKIAESYRVEEKAARLTATVLGDEFTHANSAVAACEVSG
jgi:glycosyltransferase involved in cell wall biosynthesis